jgi:hypothetical protein
MEIPWWVLLLGIVVLLLFVPDARERVLEGIMDFADRASRALALTVVFVVLAVAFVWYAQTYLIVPGQPIIQSAPVRELVLVTATPEPTPEQVYLPVLQR